MKHIVTRSSRKYFIAGAVAGRKEFVTAIRSMHNVLGGTVDPHAAFLLLRGMKTLGIRVNQQNASALEIATRLESHPCIQRVSSTLLEPLTFAHEALTIV